MIILTIRTDKPEAELGIFDGNKKLAYETWPAHRQLAETIHQKIDELLVQGRTRCKNGLQDIEGIVCFQGPGSFTGLRIGLTVGNALAYGLNIPIVATQGDDWIQAGITRLQLSENDHSAQPEYGAPVHITPPRA